MPPSPHQSLHLSTYVDRPADEVYAERLEGH
jgi:hypothetical protein